MATLKDAFDPCSAVLGSKSCTSAGQCELRKDLGDGGKVSTHLGTAWLMGPARLHDDS